MKIIKIDTLHTSYHIGVEDKGLLLHLYYGPRIEEGAENTLALYFRGGNGVPYDHSNDPMISPDVLPMEYSCQGDGDYRNTPFRISDPSGCAGCDMRYVSHSFYKGKYALPGLPASYSDNASTLSIVLCDKNAGVEVTLYYGIFYEEDIITRAAKIRNISDSEIVLNKASSFSMDFLTGQFDLIHFWGRHFSEMHFERTAVSHEGIRIGSRRGVSGHQHNTFAILADHGCSEDAGICYGISLMYSGNFEIEAEADQYSQTRIQAGISDEMLSYPIECGETFFTPEVILSFSEEGFGTLSRRYHKFIRNNVCRGKYKMKRRPILVNNWEATYFDFTGDKLVEIAEAASELGIEMFVLDDGWFGNRGPDDRGLGDWVVNEKKLGGTLDSVVKRITAKGLKFGIWIEPEMVNEDSDLYRSHPDWALTIPGRHPVLGRNQLVLDFSRKEVRDAVFESIAKVIDSADISYIKVDMNRSLCDVYSKTYSTQNFGTLCYRYMLGVYDFFERINERYPDILVEGCSSGGGRFDAGMMYYTPQVWTSDNTDAIERLSIQYGASFGYPVSVISSHVSAVPNHQTGRETDIDTRAIVAFPSNFGYELDLTRLSDDEKKSIKSQIDSFKKDWDVIHNGDYYRVTDINDYPEYMVWDIVSEDCSQAVLSAVTTNTHGNPIVHYARCKGLKRDSVYECEENGKQYSEAVLRIVGMPVPVEPGEYHAYQFHLTRINKDEF